jgi:hypothetical protein
MKRLALFFMALIVPMHLAWANISCYSHTEVSNTHFVLVNDHHEHCISHSHSHEFIEHELVNANGDEHSVHCDACHAHLSTVVQNDFTWPVHHQSYSYILFDRPLRALSSSEAPDRPQWL